MAGLVSGSSGYGRGAFPFSRANGLQKEEKAEEQLVKEETAVRCRCLAA